MELWIRFGPFTQCFLQNEQFIIYIIGKYFV